MGKIFIFLLSAILLNSCVKEDYFGYSESANITAFELSNQSGNTLINADKNTIELEVANGADLKNLILQKFSLSSFASAEVSIGDTLDFSTGEMEIAVKAENGLVATWQVSVSEIGENPQLDNSGFNVWHQEGGYLDLGADDASSTWATSNPGVKLGGISANVVQIDNGGGDYAVKLITKYSKLGAIAKKPIAAGSVFSGDFNESKLSLNNPQAALDMGVPFTGSPLSFSVDFKYSAGLKMIDSLGNQLNSTDEGDMYVLLERREAGKVQRVATAWYRISGNSSEIVRKTVEFVYGPLPNNTPEYMLPKPDETYAQSGAVPTHIVAVFSSSAKGDLYQGADGSELVIDNFELNY